MARTTIHELNVTKHLWVEVVNIACDVQNITYIRPSLDKSPYDLWKGIKPKIYYFPQFECICYILNTKRILKSLIRDLKSASFWDTIKGLKSTKYLINQLLRNQLTPSLMKRSLNKKCQS